MRKYWNRWIYASVGKHFEGVADDNGLYMYIAGRSNDSGETNEFLEIKVSGPHTTEVSHNYFKLDVVIDVVYSVHIVPENTYRARDVAGEIEDTFTDICVYKYGDGTYDDGTLLGTLILNREPTESNSFGQIDKDIQVIQGVVSAALQMTIKI